MDFHDANTDIHGPLGTSINYVNIRDRQKHTYVITNFFWGGGTLGENELKILVGVKNVTFLK